MAREIKTTLAVDGEAAFKRAIQDASKSISQMGSALTLATAQFKQDGDAMKLMETRSKTLRAEIDQQKVIVKALEGALKDVTKQFGEDSSEAQKWQAELNRAQAKLVNLETELDNNDKGLDKNGKAFDKDAQRAQAFGSELSALDKIQKSTTFQALNTALGNVERGFNTALSKGKEFGAYIWNTAVESSDRYDDLATEAIKLNVPVQALRAWDTAAKKIDTDVSDISKSLVKLVNPSNQVTEELRKLGVRTTQYTGEYGKFGAIVGQRDSIDIFWDTIEAIGKLGTVQAQEAEANKIFGKSYQELLPLIKAGRVAWDEEVRKAMETAPDEEAANKLTKFNDALVDYNRALTDFKDTISSGIAPGLTDLTNAGTTFLTKMTEWAQTPEGQEKLDKLSQSISGMVSSLATEGNFSKVVEGATAVVKGFTSALQWVIDNWKAVAIGIGAIALASGAIKVGSGVLSFLAAIKEIQWLNVASGANALANAAGSGAAGEAAAGAASAATAGSAVTTTAGTAVSGLVKGLGIGALFKTAKEVSEELGTGLWGDLYKRSQMQQMELIPIYTTPPGDPKRPKNVTGTASPESMQAYAARTAEDIYDELYKAINDYDPATNALDTNQFFDNVLYPLIQEATGSGGVLGDAANSIADLIYDKWIQSLYDEDWEGTTGDILNILQEAIDENAQGLEVITDPVLPDDAEELLQNQISRITLRVVAVPVVGGVGSGGTTGASRATTNTSNVYFGNVNVNNGIDADGLAARIAAHTRQTLAGFGG